MNELGEMLKEARIKKDYTLEDIQKTTKIQKRYLEAIEEGNLDALPGHFYARAFVKSYAEAVGLDPEVVLGQVKAELPTPTVEEHIVPLRRGRQPKAPIQGGRWLSRVLLYLFAVLILFVIYIAVSELDKTPDAGGDQVSPNAPMMPPEVEQGADTPATPDGQSPTPPSAEPTPTAPHAAAEPPAPSAALSFVQQQNNIYRYELTGAKDFSIAIQATGSCWLRVLKNGQNGEKVDELTMTPGMQKEWTLTGAQEAWIRLGSAPDVKITVNGLALDTSQMKRSSQIIAITLKP
ncbi:RodZ domain-containing protein [Ammoniphilus sp. CFH 90114]|uniref:helix-turn-helix domain-containing protein n=1 Tax=Ammoniphilus sp. CFH 90114 TaxID=2493665 RepID=UPI00100EEC41|nr:RodZ domain-containing protein [Ammoniphilus sp. CFH 90114]RXT15180.1 helix-turn-helix domain-containing protein [Ammoniphilus sp. CFH 90114]